MKSSYIFTLALLLFTLGISCNSDDEEDDNDNLPINNPGTITAVVNGQRLYFLAFGTDAELNQRRDGFVEFDFRIDGETDQDGFEFDIDLNLFGVDFDLVEEGDVFAGDGEFGELVFSGNYGKISRTPGDNTDIQTATEIGMASDQCTFTKIDRVNRLVSGTFSFNAINIFDDSDVYEVREGVFTDLEYRE